MLACVIEDVAFQQEKGLTNDIFTTKKLNYLMHRYTLRMRYDRMKQVKPITIPI